MKSRISLKPCPFCGAEVKIINGLYNVTYFMCTHKECRAIVSFGGDKQISSNGREAENPVGNFNRRTDKEDNNGR